jgi:hypothetical protein
MAVRQRNPRAHRVRSGAAHGAADQNGRGGILRGLRKLDASYTESR